MEAENEMRKMPYASISQIRVKRRKAGSYMSTSIFVDLVNHSGSMSYIMRNVDDTLFQSFSHPSPPPHLHKAKIINLPFSVVVSEAFIRSGLLRFPLCDTQRRAAVYSMPTELGRRPTALRRHAMRCVPLLLPTQSIKRIGRNMC